MADSCTRKADVPRIDEQAIWQALLLYSVFGRESVLHEWMALDSAKTAAECHKCVDLLAQEMRDAVMYAQGIGPARPDAPAPGAPRLGWLNAVERKAHAVVYNLNQVIFDKGPMDWGVILEYAQEALGIVL